MKSLMAATLGLLMAFSFVSCASKKNVRVSEKYKKNSSKGRPEWIESPADFCGEAYLCAVGEGPGLMVAQASARKNLAQVFETRVSGKSSVSTSASSRGDSASGGGEVSESYSSQIDELTNELMNGVEVNDNYDDIKGKSYYSLAKLNRAEGSSRFRNAMKALDEKMAELLKDGRRAALNKALKLWEEREALNSRYQILQGARYLVPSTYTQLMSKKREKARQAVAVFVEFDAPENAKEVKNLIATLLLQNDFKVVSDEDAKHSFTVQGSLASEQQHMNVSGFEKYKFILKIRSLNSTGAKVGGLDYSVEKSGRTFTQCLSEATTALKQYLVDNLMLLNMD